MSAAAFSRSWSRGLRWKCAGALSAGTLATVAWRSPAVAESDVLADRNMPWQHYVLSRLPLRTLSRVWGGLHSLHVPVFMRSFVFSTYARLLSMNVEEAELELSEYSSLQELFSRNLFLGSRYIAASDLVSPCDGTLTHFGRVEDGVIEHVKGVAYSVDTLLGESNVAPSDPDNNALYYAVIYLAPGDYHKVHSPAEWTVKRRAHVPGDLYPVRPSLANSVPGLFTVNERVVLQGQWKHGLMSVVPVGAFNVGSIHVTFDKEVQTNLHEHDRDAQYNIHSSVTAPRALPPSCLPSSPSSSSSASASASDVSLDMRFYDGSVTSVERPYPGPKPHPYPAQQHTALVKDDIGFTLELPSHGYCRDYEHGFEARRGQQLSSFLMGSTVVMVFEAPKHSFEWCVQRDDQKGDVVRLKMGEMLGQCSRM